MSTWVRTILQIDGDKEQVRHMIQSMISYKKEINNPAINDVISNIYVTGSFSHGVFSTNEAIDQLIEKFGYTYLKRISGTLLGDIASIEITLGTKNYNPVDIIVDISCSFPNIKIEWEFWDESGSEGSAKIENGHVSNYKEVTY